MVGVKKYVLIDTWGMFVEVINGHQGISKAGHFLIGLDPVDPVRDCSVKILL